MHRIAHLSTCDIADSGLLRDTALRPKYLREGYLDALDRTTLWYDAVDLGDRIVLVCPKLNNLEAPLRAAGLEVDGQPARKMRIRRLFRHDLITLPGASGDEVGITLGGRRFATAVSPAGHDQFRGLNTAVFISKDNELAWIAEYIRYHQHYHGLQAVAVIDNGSTAYALEDLSDSLRRSGLVASLVQSAPLKYGPRGKRPFARTEKFLQTALFNVMRLRFLGTARGVLSSDIDELLHTPGVSIFDHVQSHWPGFVILPKAWRFADPAAEGAAPQSAHYLKRGDAQDGGPKWCIRPTGPMGRFSWDTHKLEDLPLNRLFLRRFGLFWHCHDTTTGWKSHRTTRRLRGLERDEEMIAALRGAFGPDAAADL